MKIFPAFILLFIALQFTPLMDGQAQNFVNISPGDSPGEIVKKAARVRLRILSSREIPEILSFGLYKAP